MGSAVSSPLEGEELSFFTKAGDLIFRAQPADFAVCFLYGALVIERNKAGDDFGWSQRACGPFIAPAIIPGTPIIPVIPGT